MTDEPIDLGYFDRWAAAMDTATPGWSQEYQDDLKDRARRVRQIVARIRELEAQKPA